MWTARHALAVVASLAATGAVAADCSDHSFEGASYTVCEVDMARADLRLFLQDHASGTPLGSFSAVERLLKPEGKTLGFAMNAGMYHPDRSPVGLYIEAGREMAGLVTQDGPGNFGLLPNGVFCIREDRADVIETLRFEQKRPACLHATQSGPMLVIDGQLHPRFLEDGDSRHIRNGVGTSTDGRRVWFAISGAAVNFHSFGRFFRDHLGAVQALYFDGKISRLYAPVLDRFDIGFPMGPMVGEVIDAGAALD